MKEDQLHELLYQALETEQGGLAVYATAMECVLNEDLKSEWEEYRDQTERHAAVLIDVMQKLGLDTEAEPPGRIVVRHIAEGLLQAMEMARESDSPDAAELVATECVVLAETKDHQNWELLGVCAEQATGETKKLLSEAVQSVEDEEDEHLYHTAGWSRELWISSLGLPAVLPPPEEELRVRTAIGAARAKARRDRML